MRRRFLALSAPLVAAAIVASSAAAASGGAPLTAGKAPTTTVQDGGKSVLKSPTGTTTNGRRWL